MRNISVICAICLYLSCNVAQATLLKSAKVSKLNIPRHEFESKQYTIKLDNFSPQDETTVNFVIFF